MAFRRLPLAALLLSSVARGNDCLVYRSSALGWGSNVFGVRAPLVILPSKTGSKCQWWAVVQCLLVGCGAVLVVLDSLTSLLPVVTAVLWRCTAAADDPCSKPGQQCRAGGDRLDLQMQREGEVPHADAHVAA